MKSILVVSLLCVALACGSEESSPQADVTSKDQGSVQGVTGEEPSVVPEAPDAGAPTNPAPSPVAQPDAGRPVTAPAPTAAPEPAQAPTVTDAGQSVADAGTPTADAGTPAQDAGTPPSSHACADDSLYHSILDPCREMVPSLDSRQPTDETSAQDTAYCTCMAEAAVTNVACRACAPDDPSGPGDYCGDGAVTFDGWMSEQQLQTVRSECLFSSGIPSLSSPWY